MLADICGESEIDSFLTDSTFTAFNKIYVDK